MKRYNKRKAINAVVSQFNKDITQKDVMICGPKEILQSLSSGQQHTHSQSIIDNSYYWIRHIWKPLQDAFHLSVIPVNEIGYTEFNRVGAGAFLRRSVSNLQAYVSFHAHNRAYALIISLGF